MSEWPNEEMYENLGQVREQMLVKLQRSTEFTAEEKRWFGFCVGVTGMALAWKAKTPDGVLCFAGDTTTIEALLGSEPIDALTGLRKLTTYLEKKLAEQETTPR